MGQLPRSTNGYEPPSFQWGCFRQVDSCPTIQVMPASLPNGLACLLEVLDFHTQQTVLCSILWLQRFLQPTPYIEQQPMECLIQWFSPCS